MFWVKAKDRKTSSRKSYQQHKIKKEIFCHEYYSSIQYWRVCIDKVAIDLGEQHRLFRDSTFEVIDKEPEN